MFAPQGLFMTEQSANNRSRTARWHGEHKWSLYSLALGPVVLVLMVGLVQVLYRRGLWNPHSELARHLILFHLTTGIASVWCAIVAINREG